MWNLELMNQDAKHFVSLGSTPPPSRLSTLNKELEMVLATLLGKNVQTPALY